MFVYMNGKLIKQEEIRISPFDHGFLYGIGLFETFRVYNGHPFLLDNHLNRLNSGLEILNIDTKIERDCIYEALQQLLTLNQYSDAYIRLNVSAGDGEIGLRTAAYVKPNLIIFTKPLGEAAPMVEKRAVLLNIKRNTPEGNERLKSHHYMNNILAKREIGDLPDVEGVFLTENGYMAEGIVSNLFWVKDNVLYTPIVETGILNGITRQFILRLAHKNGMEIREGYYRPEVVFQADEIFVTNSIQEIVPILTFEGHDFPGVQGNVVQTLFHHYRNYCQTMWNWNELE